MYGLLSFLSDFRVAYMLGVMQMLIRGLGWPAAEVQRPGPQGQADPPNAGGVLAGPGLHSAEYELSIQLLTLQVVSSILFSFAALALEPATDLHISRAGAELQMLMMQMQSHVALQAQ